MSKILNKTSQTSDNFSNPIQPTLNIFISQVIYEKIICKYLTFSERDNWETLLRDKGQSSERFNELIRLVENRANSKISDLVKPIVERVQNDLTNTYIDTITEVMKDR